MKSPRSKQAAVGATTSVRFTKEEIEALDLICKTHGIAKKNTAIRVLVRAGGGLIETDKDVVSAWKSMGKTLAQHGNLLNQLARAANQGGLVWDKKDDQELQELRKASLKLAGMLADFADAASRRRQSAPIIDRAIEAFGDA